MGKSSVAKATPVAIPDTALALCELYVDTNNEKKAAEAKLKTLKDPAMKLVPTGQQTEEFSPAIRGDRRGKYRVTIVEQDRRKIDDEKLIALLLEKKLYTPSMMKTTVDHEKVVQLVEVGTLSKEDIEACMTGTQPTYPLVEFVET